jgi:hypothetical protein
LTAELARIIIDQNREDKMELAVVIVAIVVAGALIPGNSKIRFFR